MNKLHNLTKVLLVSLLMILLFSLSGSVTNSDVKIKPYGYDMFVPRIEAYCMNIVVERTEFINQGGFYYVVPECQNVPLG